MELRSSLARSRVLAMLAAIPAVGYAAPGRAQSAKVRVGTIPAETYAEPLYLLDGGFFAKAGIDIELSLFTTGAQMTSAVAGGALDIGLADAIQLGNAFNRGLPFGFFASSVQYQSTAPTTQLCVAKNGPIKVAKDLEGQTIGLYGLGSMPELSAREWLHSHGVDLTTVKFIEIPPSALNLAVRRGTVAAGMIGEPWLCVLADNGLVPFANAFDACAKSFYINSWFADRGWLAKNPETVRKLRAAIFAGAQWANTHHAETEPILAKYAKLDVDTINRMVRATYATEFDPKKLQPPLDIAWKYHALEKPLTAAQLMVTA